MSGRDIIVVGASSGGVNGLIQLVHGLPPGFPATIFVVCHFPPGGQSVLPDILSRSGPLVAMHARDGEPFYPGQIYVAPPDHHLLLERNGIMRLTRGARENHHRPAVDPLFRSAAREYGSRVIGLILSGALHDGTAGLMAIREAGGLAIAQDPHDAAVAAMPQSARDIAGVHYVVAAADMSALLVRLVHQCESSPKTAQVMDPIEKMPAVVDNDMAKQVRNERIGEVSVFTCPECGGALWQVPDNKTVRFRCHVGHSYNAEILLADQTEALEAALWTAVRTFREKSVLGQQLAARAAAAGDNAVADRYREQSKQAADFGQLIVTHVLSASGRTTGDNREPPIQNSFP